MSVKARANYFAPLSIDVDVDDEDVMDQMSMQEEEFAKIDDMLNVMGIGTSKDMAKISSSQFLQLVAGVELKDSPTLPEEQYGRKLFKNTQAMFTHDWGNVLKAVVKVNYPLSRFIDMRGEEMKNLNSQIAGAEMSAPNEPKLEFFNISAKVKISTYNKMVASERANATGTRTRDQADTELKIDEAAHAEIKEEFEAAYVEKYTQYNSELETYNVQLALKKSLGAKLERTAVLSAIVEGLRNAANAITSKLKSAAGLHDKVKQKLSARVVLESTDEMIDNPFDNNNLSGMMQLLQSAYFTATLVHFNADFQRVLGTSVSKEDATKNPMKAITLVEKNMATWTTMNYWEYMTPDVFWTNLVLRALPAGEFQSKCVEHVVSYITQKEAGDGRDDKSRTTARTAKSMPIFDNLRAFIQRQEDSGRHKSSSQVSTTPQQPQLQQQQPTYSHYGASKPKGNVEHAYAAVAEPFTTQVGRDKEVKCKDVNNGLELPYTATTEACPQCCGRTGQFHRPKCYCGHCRKCMLFGHKMEQCKQDPSSYKKA